MTPLPHLDVLEAKTSFAKLRAGLLGIPGCTDQPPGRSSLGEDPAKCNDVIPKEPSRE